MNFTRLIAITALLISGTAFGQTLDSSSHDLVGSAFGATAGDNGEICVYCHTPHNSSGVIAAPLWNRQGGTLPTYTEYTSDTMDGTAAVTGPTSLACLSCHDGTLSVAAILNVPGGGTAALTGGSAIGTGAMGYIGTDLSNDHPIGMSYADSGTGLKSIPTSTLTFFSDPGETVTDVVECATCHAVHVPGTSGSFLRVENANSALCFTCHNK